MAGHKIRSNKKTDSAEYVTVAIAEDTELAEEYQDVLNCNFIPTVLRTQRGGNSEILGIAITVPEQMTEQATAIIESQQAFDDFLDVAFNGSDEDEDNYFDDFEEEDDFGDDDF